MSHNIELYLFDLGGVLIELSGSPLPSAEMSVSNWLVSTTAKEFESGQVSRYQFAESFKRKHGIAQSVEDIIDHFRKWPKGFYSGATDFIKALSAQYRVAALSNTNEIHWPRLTHEFGANELFEKIIASHAVGMAKPDVAIYRHALRELNVAPENTVFIDDNEINVQAAKEVGINAYHAKGLAEVVRLISNLEQANGCSNYNGAKR